jgi:sensor histidine kinase YesM
MLFIPFIENAFKFSSNSGIMPVVKIELTCSGDVLYFICTNFVSDNKPERTGGVGLENVKRRLELLYPGKHNLLITNGNGLFVVSLEIQLTKGYIA